jgi:tRNA pseudouridine synthase 9
VHIQHLGFPIANDPIYYSKHSFFSTTTAGLAPGMPITKEDLKAEVEKREDIVKELKKRDPNESEYYADDEKACIGCLHPKRDPTPEELEIYLHAFRYEGPGWSFEIKEADRPPWCSDAFDDSFLEARFWKHGGLWDGVYCGEYGPPPPPIRQERKEE